MAWKPVSARLCYLRVPARPDALSVICAYAPTQEASQDDKDEFYQQLQELLAEIPRRTSFWSAMTSMQWWALHNPLENNMSGPIL